MAFEVYGMLAGNVSPMTGENVEPAYGGTEEAFLQKVVTPIYLTIAKVCFCLFVICIFHWCFYSTNSFDAGSRKEQERKIKTFTMEKLWWLKWIFLVIPKKFHFQNNSRNSSVADTIIHSISGQSIAFVSGGRWDLMLISLASPQIHLATRQME